MKQACKNFNTKMDVQKLSSIRPFKNNFLQINRLNSILIGVALFASSFAMNAQISGNAIALDGADDFIAIPQIATGWNDVTIETWINLSKPQAASGYGIYNTDSWLAGNPHFQIWEKEIQFIVNGNNNLSAPYIFTPNTWNHIAVTYRNGVEAKLYINGNLIKTVAMNAGVYANLTAARIGSWAGSRFFNGQMDEYRIWDKVKTQAEIENEMYKKLTGNEANLRLYYNFNHGSAEANNIGLTSVKDSAAINSAIPLNGTLTNSALNGNISNYVVSECFAPHLFEATNIYDTRFVANWQKVATATKYRIDVSDKSDFSNLLVSNLDAGNDSKFSVNVPIINAGTIYYYRLRYESASGVSNNSNTKQFIYLSSGNAIALDGIDDHVVATTSVGWTMPKLTIEAWVYCNSNTANIPQFITSNGAEQYEIHIGNALNNSLRFIPTTKVYLDVPAESLVPNQWNHIACTYDPSLIANTKIYINGISTPYVNNGANPLTTPLVTSGDRFSIGARTNAGNFLNGKLDEVRVWNVIRSEGDIKANMFQSLAGNETGLLCYYNFNQGVAGGDNQGLVTIPDLTGKGNTSKLLNGGLAGSKSNYVSSSAYNFVLDATNVTTTGLTARWIPVYGATKYWVEISIKPDFSYNLTSVDAGLGTLSGSALSFDVTGINLTPGVNYYYRVSYETEEVPTAYSEIKQIRVATGNALAFDGTNDYVDLGTMSPAGNFATGFSYMGWVRYNSFNSWSRIFDFGVGENSYNILLANNGNTNTLYMGNRTGNGTAENFVSVPNALKIGQWVHIAATISTSGVGKLYVNGKNVAMGTTYIPSNVTRAKCYLGRSNWAADAYFNGSMDEISFWNRTLSDDEIKSYMNSSLAGNESGLYAYYNFNQGIAGSDNSGITTLNDSTSNIKNGTLTNFALTGTASNWVSSSANTSTQTVPFVYNASNVTTTGFTANWKAISGATKYLIDVSDKSDFSNLLLKNFDAGNATSKDITGLNLSLGANYYYRMRYENTNITSSNSATEAFMVGTGNSLNFDDVGNYIAVPTLGTGLTEFTIEQWINIDASSNSTDIFKTIASNTGSVNFEFGSNFIRLAVQGNSPSTSSCDYTFNYGQWYHIATTYIFSSATSAQTKMYVNGDLITTTIYKKANQLSLTDARIGSLYDNNRWFLDNFRIWNKARTQAEIKATMNTDMVGNEANLLLSYNFNQGVPNGNNSDMLDPAYKIANLPDATGVNTGYLRGFALTGTSSNFVNITPSSNVFYVNKNASPGGNGYTPATAFNNLQSAFLVATGNDTIKVATGTYYQPAYNTSFINYGKSLTLLGGYNDSFTICDATTNTTTISGLPGANISIIRIVNSSFSIDGFTLTNGSSNVEGGAIKFSADNSAYNINVSNCIFLNNKTTSGNGGAIWMNTSYSKSKATISNCKFTGNSVAGSGGAIADGKFTTTITNCVFENNEAPNFDGGAIIKWGLLTISNSTFVNNKCSGNGGAIELQMSTATITNSTFFGNQSGNGTVHVYNGSGLFFNHNTVVGNTSPHCGGVANYYNSTVQIFGNIIVGNEGNASYADIWNQPLANTSYVIIDNGYNIFSSAGLFTIYPTSQWVNSEQLYNILESTDQSNKSARLFPAKLADNGGITPTVKIIGRALNNKAGSPIAIRFAPNTYGITTDQRGVARRLGNATIGAYESDVPSAEKVVYVNGSLSALGDGRTPATAYNNLQTAIMASANDTIKIAAGTYMQPAVGRAFGNDGLKNLILVGAYNTDFTMRDTILYKTTLQANGASVVPILWLIDCNVTLDGLTFQNGKASAGYEGGAIHFHVTSAANNYYLNVSNCQFFNNTQTDGYGGAIWAMAQNTSSGVNLSNCTFIGNSALGDAGLGGAIASTIITFNISNCSFINNSARNVGGAIYFDRVTSVIKNSTFFGNTTTINAGAIWAGDQVGGSASNISLIQNTIVGNFNSNTYGAGAISCLKGVMSLQGNIIAGNYSNVGDAYDVGQQGGIVTDNGYNIFGTNGAFQFTPNASSIVIPNSDLYKILESANQSDTTKRLFPALVRNNEGATPTIKLIGKIVNGNINICNVPAVVNSITMPTTDQRGVSRVNNKASIGAYEMERYLHVKWDAPANGIGTVNHPYNNLSLALTRASSSDSIFVAAGVYEAPVSSFLINKNTTLIGGYSNDFKIYDPKQNITSIKFYTGSNPLIKIANTSAEINGFVIQNSVSTDLGGGVLVSITDNKPYNIVFSNCLFNNNKATNGSGICLNSTSSTDTTKVSISNCTFTGNASTSNGGAISSNGRFATNINNNTFYNNSATNNGGAIWIGQNGTSKIAQNTIVGNICTTPNAGGGIACSGGNIDLAANIIAGNYSGINKHEVYEETGTITDRGYNLFGKDGISGFLADTHSTTIETGKLYGVLDCDSTKLASFGNRQFYAKVTDNGGATPTIKLLQKFIVNIASEVKAINIVPSAITNIVLSGKDQRGTNRIDTASCIGSYEEREELQTQNIQHSSLTSMQVKLRFSAGSFSNRLVFIKQGSVSPEIPAKGVAYTANSTFGEGSQIDASGWYCVYSGADTTVTVVGLSPVKTYQVKAFEFNTSAEYFTNLSSAVGNPISFTTPKAVQKVEFTLPTNNKYGDVHIALPIASNIGILPVQYSSTDTSVAVIINEHEIQIVGAGTTTITATQAGNDSVAVAPEYSKVLSVAKVPLTITADTLSRAYFQENPLLTFECSGFVKGDDTDDLIAQPNISTVATKTTNGGVYSINITGAVSNNYDITYIPATLTIAPSTIQIGLVTVDNATAKNKIIWERQRGFNIASYTIYREGTAINVYDSIGNVPFDVEGIFIDSTSKPSEQQSKYKIAAIDSVGNSSAMSNYHRPMFLQYNNATNGINMTWQPYAVEGMKADSSLFKSYILYKGHDSTKLDSFKILPAGDVAFIDKDEAAMKYRTYYQIGGVLHHPIHSETLLKASGGPFSQSISNLEDNRLKESIGVNQLVTKELDVMIYPNPFTQNITLAYTLNTRASVTIGLYNIFGVKIADIINNEIQDAGQINIALHSDTYQLTAGIYYLVISIDGTRITKEIIKY